MVGVVVPVRDAVWVAVALWETVAEMEAVAVAVAVAMGDGVSGVSRARPGVGVGKDRVGGGGQKPATGVEFTAAKRYFTAHSICFFLKPFPTPFEQQACKGLSTFIARRKKYAMQ